MENSLVFVFPNARSTDVHRRPARLICDRLWNLGLTPGAGTAAARISDALHSDPALQVILSFGEREVAPTLEAAKSHPPTWARLAEAGTFSSSTLDQRRQLVQTCLDLIVELSADAEHEKLRDLTADLERVRDQLLSVTARELLRRAADRIASGWSQRVDARAANGDAVDVLDPAAVSWSLLGALQAAAFSEHELQPEEIRCAVAAIAALISDPSLPHWNDRAGRTHHEVRALLARAQAATEQTFSTFD